MIEADNVFTQEEPNNSIGARIKRYAIALHDLYLNSEELLTTKQRSIMALGLSSILNLGNNSEDTQKTLFSDEEWASVKSYYAQKYEITQLPLPFEASITVWNKTTAIVKDKGLFSGLKYVASIKGSKKTSERAYKYLCVFEHVLQVLNNDKSTLNLILSKYNTKVSEQDVFDLWSPIFKNLISVNNLIRLKKGETVNPSSTEEKKLQYPEGKHVVGFKIDFRILVDYEDKEVDLAAGEVAINSFVEDKVIHDKVKLLCEAKDIADRHVNSHFNNSHGWSIQICGLEGIIQTIHLDKVGLYVLVPQSELVFPRDISELHKFNNTLQSLTSLITNLEKQAQCVLSHYTAVDLSKAETLSDIRQTEEVPGSPVRPFCYKQRPTYYTPPSNDRMKSVIPEHLFGSLNSKRKQPEQDRLTIEKKKRSTRGREAIDEFGWFQLENGMRKNQLSGEVSEERPY